LNKDLVKRHQLVREAGQKLIGDSLITQYKFSHALVQQYLYNDLGEGELRQLHLEVGESQEKRYKRHLAGMENQLALHFSRAGKVDKALNYHKIAAERAHARFAYLEAVSHVDKALTLVNEDDLSKKFELLLLRESANATMANLAERSRDLGEILNISKMLGETNLQTEAALRLSLFEYQMSNYEESIKESIHAISLAQSTDDFTSLAYGYFYFGRSMWNMRKYEEAKNYFGKSKDFARKENLIALEADNLRNMGIIAELENCYSMSEEYHKKALEKHRDIKDLRGEGFTLNSLGILNRINGKYSIAKDYLHQALGVWTSIGDLFGQASWFAHMGLVNLALGEWNECENNLEQALSIHRQIENKNGEAFTLNDLGHLNTLLGKFDSAWDYFEAALPVWGKIEKKLGLGWLNNFKGQFYVFVGDFHNAHSLFDSALEIAKRINNPLFKAEVLNNLGILWLETDDLDSAHNCVDQSIKLALDIRNQNTHASGLNLLGRIMERLGRIDEARNAYQDSIDLFNSIERTHITIEPMAGIARTKFMEGMFSEAIELVDLMLNQIEERGLDGTNDPGLIFLTCCKVLEAAEDDRANDTLIKAYNFLQARTENIKRPEQSGFFLETIKSNREIVEKIRNKKALDN
jgi:tetratricopeptide (TPR) repeat protein